MSCIIASDNHISALVLYASKLRYGKKDFPQLYTNHKTYDLWNGDHVNEIIYQLRKTNCESYYATYPQHAGDHYIYPVTFQADLKIDHLSPVDILSMIHGLEYNSDTVDNWFGTKAFEILKAIQNIALDELDGWDDATWLLP